ncbi:hypothetical protein Ais01nite_26060 [Asanoa ishikariensis]|uniref:LPXTG-motif cell wall anchor domain-containing protein n=1 Tax=Asanoa ishikariensis TaxID=137265 RepID=A0A1H3QZI5_9ACTN|nr:hypothetical protein [Asanoa ishikariensis]GIF64571.1 hypothetical protein Ais01nite_26060 [Asanoa ishikariensis]SDZ18653.1 hypothetical protein SAMN05421684_3314 [Asanoa ishikariensis]
MRRVLLGALVVLAVVGMAGTPATAHPFGPPSTANVTVHGSSLKLVWHAAEDDWVALGQSVGAFDDPATDVTGEQKLQRSPAVRTYLLDRMTVRQAGQGCPGSLHELTDVLATGATITYECPADVDEVKIRLAALMDLNEAYRTVLVGDSEALFTATSPEQQLRLSGSSSGLSTVLPLAIGTAVVVVLGLAALVVLRRRRRRSA